MKITLCARSKILQLLGVGRVIRVLAHRAEAGSHLDLVPDTSMTELDNTISKIPLVVVDDRTAMLLAGQNIDFDYDAGEFIISNRGKE